MDRKSTIHTHEIWTENVPYTHAKHGQKAYHTKNTKHGQKKYHTHTHEIWTEKEPYANTKHGQKKYHTQILNLDRKSAVHKH